MNRPRIKHIDIAKGVGIILIVASHVVLESDAPPIEVQVYKHWCNLIGSFYVPLFFLLSGIFESHETSWNVFFSRITRLGKYIFVFWLWGILSYILINRQLDIIKAANTYTPIGFLYVLLLCVTFFRVIKTLPSWAQYLIVMTLGGADFIFLVNKHSFFFVGQTLLVIPFYAVGYWMKDWLKHPSFRWKFVVVGLFTWLLPTLFFREPQNVALNLVGRDFFSFYLAAFSGSVLLIELSKLINIIILIWIGKNSLIIMMVHMLFQHINYNIFFIPIDSWWVWMAFVVVWVVLSCLWIPVFRNKYYKII